MTMKLRRLFLDSVFDANDFTEDQIKELEAGLENSYSVRYMNPFISAENMRKIRTGDGSIKLKLTLK